jgi:hypothetical protein
VAEKKNPQTFIDTAAFSIHFRDLSFAHSAQGRKKEKPKTSAPFSKNKDAI